MTTRNDNLVRRLPKGTDAIRAVSNMMAEMADMWTGFRCDFEIIADRRRGAHVIIHVPLADDPAAWDRAYLYRSGDEFVCIPECYVGETTEFRGTQGTWYTVDDCGVLVVA